MTAPSISTTRDATRAAKVPHPDPLPPAAGEGGRCGAERDRTVGPLNAIEVLSQLSYSPDRRLASARLN
jgi:hypothetical protein